jgi:hyaluronan synthase
MLKIQKQTRLPLLENKENKTPLFFETQKGKVLDFFIKISVVAFLFGILWASIHTGAFLKPWLFFTEGKFIRLLTYSFILYSFISGLYFIFKTILWLFYKPYPIPQAKLPFVSVIIPAYNEGKMVEKTILRAVSCGYPFELLEVIAVDDGSKDDTFLYMQKAKAKAPNVVKLVRLPKNSGKRHALYAGFLQAKGEIFVTIDSDSLIEKGGIHHLVAPFVQDKKVGAVAGNVKVLNQNEGLIPKMLGVSFVFSFDFTRACESVYGMVQCCPGAFSAYRADLVREVMDAWLNQRFLGVSCTYGEDRALTNFILRKGFYTVFQSTAKVFTLVPTTYTKLCKMFLRWERSNVRETVVLGSFIATQYRKRDRLLPFLEFVMKNLRYPVQYYAFAFVLFNLMASPLNIFRYLSVIGLMGVAFSLYYLKTERNFDFLYGILYSFFSILALQWIFPYACLTVKSRSWLTR